MRGGGAGTAVVIPTYNRGAMAVEAARSALAQRSPVDVVVVDDGSTDDTPRRLEALVRDARETGATASLRVVRQENRERGAARNRGAEEAENAEFLLFLDADDVLEPDHVERLTALALLHPEAPLLASAALLCDPALRPFEVLGRAGPGPGSGREDGRRAVHLEDFLRGKEPLPPTVSLIRSRAFREVGGFDEDRALAGSEDWLLHARLLTLGPCVRHGAPTALIRRHGGNTMGDPDRMLESMLRAHRRFFDEPPPHLPPPSGELRASSRARLLLQAATQFYAVGEGREARARLLEAAREDPGVGTDPLWAWTWLRSLLPHGLSRRLRRRKTERKRRRGIRGSGGQGIR